MSSPSSEIYLLAMGNQLTADMHHTYRFASASAQQTFFGIGTDGGFVKRFKPTQYIRVSENEVKVPYPKEAIEGAYSYMAIKTSQEGVEDRIWYAFIVDLEYVSDMCTKITFKVDPIQTFLFGGGAEVSWAHVERCHQSTDTIGDNRVAEPFSVPSYVYNEKQMVQLPLAVIVEVMQKISTTHGAVAIPTSIFFALNSATSYYAFDMTNTGQRSNLRAMLQDPSLEQAGALVSLYTCPLDAVNRTDQVNAGTNRLNDDEFPSIKTISKNSNDYSMTIEKTGVNGSTTNNKIDGYTPKNNKLFTYPYNVLEVTNTSGEEAIFKFEEWDSSPSFSLETTWVDPVATIIPVGYEKTNGTPVARTTNYRYGLSIKDFPVCGYGADAYQTWMAQRSEAKYLGLVAKGVSSVTSLGIMAGGVAAGAVAPFRAISGSAITAASFGMSLSDTVEEVIEAKNKPDTLVSDLGGTTNAIPYHHFGFEFGRMTVNSYYAEIIDNFFTQYGYAQDKLMDIQNWIESNIRTRYKYIKTTDAHINGSCPARYKDELETIFNRGITFWESNQTIGDYSTDNPIVT